MRGDLKLGKRLGCLHAHYSNIEYIENAFAPYNIELIHFVDPGLMNQVTKNKNFRESEAQRKVIEQIEWIAQCQVDAILITCTNYIAFYRKTNFQHQCPSLKLMNLSSIISARLDNLRPFFFQILPLLKGQWNV